MSFRDSVANFFRYVMFFVCLAGAGLGGLYLYNRSKQQEAPPPAETAEAGIPAPGIVENPVGHFPSQWLQPVMTQKLPALLASISEPYDLGADFKALEQRILEAKAKDLERQNVWNTAAALCREMHSLQVAQNSAAATFQEGEPAFAKGSGTHSKEDIKDAVAKRQFFMQNAQQRWTTGALLWKKKITLLYTRLQAEEKLAP